MCDFDGDGDPSDVWDETCPRARRQHRCQSCTDPICVGQKHVRIGSLSDGRWTTLRAHTECLALARYILLHVCRSDTYTPQIDLRHEVREHYRDEPGLLRRYRDCVRSRRGWVTR